MATTAIRKIPAENMAFLEAEVAQLNRRADRLGVTPLVIDRHGIEVKVAKHPETGVEYSYEIHLVSITGQSPVLNGWKLVSRKTPVVTEDADGKEHIEMMFANVPGETVPVEYRTNGVGCDHCNADRRRKDVFVLRHEDGRTKQVGRQCIADFLGHRSPESMLACAEWLTDADSLLSDAEHEGFGCRGERGIQTALFLSVVSVCSRKLGWVSGAMQQRAYNEGRDTVTTSATAWSVLTDTSKATREFIEEKGLRPDEQDSKLAEAALTWGRALPTDQDNDYRYNLGVACRRPVVDYRSKGIVASVIVAYQKQMQIAEEKARRARQSKHVGTIGVRSGFPGLTLKFSRGFEGQYGVTTLHRFEDADGNTIVWWGSGESDYEVGQTYNVTATVKAHDDYQGMPQTVVQRVVEGLPKVKVAKSRKKVKTPETVAA